MKYLRIFIIIFLIPFIALAEECDVSNITITSMEPNKIEGNTEVISEPTFEDRTINLNLKMHDVGDSISYDMTIKNDSEEDYMIDEDTFKTDSDYIEYTLKTKDNTNVVKANSTKEVSLIVTYKKEVEDDKLTNNKFNASNTLKLSLNTSEKEQPLDIITTDNIKEVKNPVTSVSSMMLISIILLTSVIIIYILLKRKNKYTKYLLIILSMILIPTVYAICTCDIEVESTIEIEKKQKLFDTIANIAKEDNSCVTKYEGEVTDEVGKNVTATNVYFDKCEDMDNVIFGGFCWKVIRTTETGGTKLIYFGEPVDGKCEYNREQHLGIKDNGQEIHNLNNRYLYGNSYIYDLNNRIFRIINTFEETWSDSTYENLIGKYTCKSQSDTCTTLYLINNYSDSTSGKTISYIIDQVKYYYMGMSVYNYADSTPELVGYMFNKKYMFKSFSPYSTYNYGSSFTYDANTNTYTLAGDIISKGSYSTTNNGIGNHHYTCWNTSNTCTTLSYIYSISLNSAYYVELINGRDINDLVEDMFYAQNVNKYNSNIKSLIDSWYFNNMNKYTDKLEDTVYCNNRRIAKNEAWDSTSDLTFPRSISFGNDIDTNLICPNETDQFSLSNNKAKLTYPIALITNPEVENNINMKSWYSPAEYWGMSPKGFYTYGTYVYYYTAYSMQSLNSIGNVFGVRPVISIKNNALISSGTGSESEPWIIE